MIKGVADRGREIRNAVPDAVKRDRKGLVDDGPRTGTSRARDVVTRFVLAIRKPIVVSSLFESLSGKYSAYRI